MKITTRLTEKQFTAQVIQLASLYGWRAYHTFDSRRSAAGFPDLVLVNRKAGRLIFAELKVGKNTTTAAQDEWIADLGAVPAADPLYGRTAYVWRPADWEEIEKVLRGHAV